MVEGIAANRTEAQVHLQMSSLGAPDHSTVRPRWTISGYQQDQRKIRLWLQHAVYVTGIDIHCSKK